MRTRLWQRLPDRRTCGLLGLCLAIAWVLDFLYFTGYYASDDVLYLKAARQVASPGSEIDGFSWQGSIAHTRLGITLPSGLLFWITGGSIVAIAWFHVLYHLALVPLAYAIGRELHDARTGLLAAALVAVNPILYVHAGAILPDNATAVWLAVLLLLLLRARRRALEQPLPTGESFRRYFVAGLVLGVAYACKETAIIMTVPCAAVIVAAAPRLRSTVWIRDGGFLAIGLLAFVLLETLLLRALAHEWMFRLGELGRSSDAMAERMVTQGSMPLDRLSHLWWRGLFSFMPATAILLLVVGLSFPLVRRRNLALVAFLWWPLLYMTLGSTSFTEYRPSSIQARYYAIVIVPAVVMTALVLVTLLDRLEAWSSRPRWAGRRGAVGVVVITLALITGYEARRNRGLAGNLYHGRSARAFMAALREARSSFPDLPITMSPDYRKRMEPLRFSVASGAVFTRRMLAPQQVRAAPPFILLSPRSEALPEGRSTSLGREHGEIEVRTISVVFPERGRFEILVDALGEVFGASGGPVPTTPRGAAVIQMVTEATP